MVSIPRSGFSRTLKGVAPNVNLISLKVLDQNGAGQEKRPDQRHSDRHSTEEHLQHSVLNLSVGTPVFESYTLDPLCQAVEPPTRPASSW